MDVSKPWHQNYTPEPIDVSHVNIIDALISNGVPDWTRFGSEFKIKTIEADRISQAELRQCLIGLRSPLVTYDYDLWYHSIDDVHMTDVDGFWCVVLMPWLRDVHTVRG
jgi:hypothetical protein